MKNRPVIAYNRDEAAYEKEFDKLLQQYPLPEDVTETDMSPPKLVVKKI